MLRPRDLVWRGLVHYWRTHVAVVLGVATAVAVLAGALLVGDSVRGSLRDLVLQRLGRADLVLLSDTFFREQLATDLSRQAGFDAQFAAASPFIVLQGVVAGQTSGRRAGQVLVYGVDDRFWRFHGVEGLAGPQGREALLSPALAVQVGAGVGDAVLMRVERPFEVPLESLHGRRDDMPGAVRLTVGGIVPPSSLGEFSLAPQQGEVRAVFVPLAVLQDELDATGQVNAVLVADTGDATAPGDRVAQLEQLVVDAVALADVGLFVRSLEAQGLVLVGSDSGLLDDAAAAAIVEVAAAMGFISQPVLTYLANTIRVGDREVPYSLVTATDLTQVGPGLAVDPGVDPPILLNQWAADALSAASGDVVTLEYYVWEEPGRLVTRTAELAVSGVVPVEAGDADLAPVYAGISDADSLVDWDPPFTIDLSRIRPVDEAYWEQYRTTPKAFVPLAVGQALWQSRYGELTSVRLAPPAGEPLGTVAEAYATRLGAALDPFALGMAVRDVRAEGLAAATGTTDFGAYFLYFSFFLVVSALLLAALFFKLGVEQRVREVGLLRAVGFGPGAVRRLFVGEGLLLSVAGGVLGVLGALGYGWLMIAGLRSWWMGAVGTMAITLHVSPLSLAAGWAGGVVAAVACIWWTLRSLDRLSARILLAGQARADAGGSEAARGGRRIVGLTAAAVAVGTGLIGAGAAGWVAPAGAFFGAGSALLVGCLAAVLLVLQRRPRAAVAGHGWESISRLGLRYAAYRPGRSVLSIAVIASATFILIAVDAFRRGEVADLGPGTGLGGYALRVDTLAPVVHDPNAPEGREALNLFDLPADVVLEPFRVRPGDDASCLNLYQPQNPRIVAPRDTFLAEGRFAFQASLAETDAERANPWLLLHRAGPDGAIPVIADANSMTYVLHRRLGEEVVIPYGAGVLRLRLVAALRDSILQGELIMSEANFRQLFPEQEGARMLLVETPDGTAADVTGALERALADYGADAVGTAERLASFHQVENTFLSTFQTLGGFGLLLGTIGLATVLLRNVLERRHELALLGAIGYRRRHFLLIVVAENALLLTGGVVIGAVCAGLAIAPAVAERGGRLPLTGGGAALLFAVVVTGLLSSAVATRVATGGPLLASLRSE